MADASRMTSAAAVAPVVCRAVQLIRIKCRVPEYARLTRKVFHLLNLLVNGMMNLLEQRTNGLEKFGGTDNTTYASRYAWVGVPHERITISNIL
ncbi:unnamed protein product [Urochloa humidicola]